jgi:hypothetical protein
MMSDTVTANLVAIADHVLEHCDVIGPPVNLPPIIDVIRPKIVGRVRVGGQEESGRNAVPVENRKGFLKLASKPIVKGKRHERWHISILCPQAFGSPIDDFWARFRPAFPK